LCSTSSCCSRPCCRSSDSWGSSNTAGHCHRGKSSSKLGSGRNSSSQAVDLGRCCWVVCGRRTHQMSCCRWQ
jgi:hypothetical protein